MLLSSSSILMVFDGSSALCSVEVCINVFKKFDPELSFFLWSGIVCWLLLLLLRASLPTAHIESNQRFEDPQLTFDWKKFYSRFIITHGIRLIRKSKLLQECLHSSSDLLIVIHIWWITPTEYNVLKGINMWSKQVMPKVNWVNDFLLFQKYI